MVQATYNVKFIYLFVDLTSKVCGKMAELVMGMDPFVFNTIVWLTDKSCSARLR